MVEPSNADLANFDELILFVEQGACVNEASATAYGEASARYERIYAFFGISIIVLTAGTSASLVQAIGQTSAHWQKLTAAILSAVATALAATQTFLKATDKAKALDHSAREFLAISGDHMSLLFHLQLLSDDKQRVTDDLRRRFLEADRQRRAVEAAAPALPRHYADLYEQKLKPAALAKAQTAAEKIYAQRLSHVPR